MKITRRERNKLNKTVEPSKRIGEIYIGISPSKKYYVGQTISTTKERWSQHEIEAFDPKRKDVSRALNAAIRAHGKQTFEVVVVWRGEVGEDNCKLNEMECHFIKQYNSLAPNGYNLREGGNGAMSEEAIRQMIDGNIVKTENKRRYQPDECLPKFVLYHREINKKGTVLEGYKVSDHPNGTNKSFLKKSMTMNEKRDAAIAYKVSLDTTLEFIDNTKKLPKGVCKYGNNGFSVRKRDGTRKFFGSLTREENLKLALDYYKSI